MSLGDRVLDWLLRRLGKQRPIDSDLVLVQAHEALADTPPSFEHRGERWHFVAPRGELGLREALLRGGRLVAAVPDRLRLPLDLVERAYLRQLLTIEAHDIVAAAAGSLCVPLRNQALAEAILRRPRLLVERGAAWTSTGQAITEAEVREVLVAAELGFDRKLARLPPSALLEQWILGDPPSPALPDLMDEVLRATHGQVGSWLAWAARERRVGALIAAGALAGTARARALGPSVPGVNDERAWEALRALVEDAVRGAATRSRSAVSERLAEAEGLAHRAGLGRAEAPRHPLLRAALDAALFEHAEAAAEGRPAPEEEILPLTRNLHAGAARDALDLVLELGRVARFCNAAGRIAPEPDATAAEWARFARDDAAWADLAARAARRLGEHAPADLAAPRRRVLERYLAIRDELNRRFAETLARDEAAAYRKVTLPEPLPLHDLTRMLIRPLVEAGRRVFLLVLDGCDLASLYELLRSRTDDVTAGLALPPVSGQLGGDLQQAGALHVGLSPLPTVTSHARRALFAGEIPKNPVLDDTEAAAANARADSSAWERNAALAGIPHRLLLKGDLGPEGASLIKALEKQGEQVLAAVFNGIDDALSSHETTAMPSWTWGHLGSGLKAVLNAAVRRGWTIVVTSDHGHTPFWSTERKVAAQGSSQRYSGNGLPGAVSFPPAGLRSAPLHLLTGVGAFVGTQRRGYHGGAGLEEVVVPIALLGTVTVPELKPVEPLWWRSEWEEPAAVSPAPQPAPRTAPAASSTVLGAPLLPADLRAALHDQPKYLKVLELIAEKGVITASQLGALMEIKAIFKVRGLVGQVQLTLQRLRIAVPFTAEDQQDETVYRWKIRS